MLAKESIISPEGYLMVLTDFHLKKGKSVQSNWQIDNFIHNSTSRYPCLSRKHQIQGELSCKNMISSQVK